MDVSEERHSVAPSAIRLYREPEWVLNVSVCGHPYADIRVVRAAPLTCPDRYICFLDANEHEICIVEDPFSLDADTRRILKEELDRRYLTSEIRKIHSARREGGACYFETDTNRGRREFVVQETPEALRWLGDHRLLLIDVDGNRFEARDIRLLDRKSAKLLMLIA
jgi:hypothetical protein